jgi:hypothetical protein
MPTVRCPSCHRALHLPEAHPGGTARCPLCQSTFPTPSTQVPTVSAPRAEVLFPESLPSRPLDIPPLELPNDAPPRHLPPPLRPDPVEFLPNELRESLRAAARHLKSSAWLACAYLFTCGCINEKVLEAALGFDWSVEALAAVAIVRLVMLGLIYAGAVAMERCRARRLALTSAVLVLCLSGYVLLWPLLVVYEMCSSAWRVRPGSAALSEVAGCGAPWVVSLLAFLVASFGLWAGVHALHQLAHPEVRRASREQQ